MRFNWCRVFFLLAANGSQVYLVADAYFLPCPFTRMYEYFCIVCVPLHRQLNIPAVRHWAVFLNHLGVCLPGCFGCFKVECSLSVGAGRAGRLFKQTLALGLACAVCLICLTAQGRWVFAIIPMFLIEYLSRRFNKLTFMVKDQGTFLLNLCF